MMSLVWTQGVQNAFELDFQKEGQQDALICESETEESSMDWDY